MVNPKSSLGVSENWLISVAPTPQVALVNTIAAMTADRLRFTFMRTSP